MIQLPVLRGRERERERDSNKHKLTVNNACGSLKLTLSASVPLFPINLVVPLNDSGV